MKYIITTLFSLSFFANLAHAEEGQRELIHKQFAGYRDYVEEFLYRRLKKDEQGNIDAVAIYDAQTHLMNAAIYADENGDLEMLKQLLGICKIPFESQHLTDGKWLHRKSGHSGIETVLYAAQFSSLATRVLSACQRHGIKEHFTEKEIQMLVDRVNQWTSGPPTIKWINDRYLFFIQSALLLDDYFRQIKKENPHHERWKAYAQNYMKKAVDPKWEMATHAQNGKTHECWMLDRTGWPNYIDYSHAGYGREITPTKSDTDPNSMYNADGTVKQPPKRLKKVATDISHARRHNWFFEVLKRFGHAFDITISDRHLQGWANTIAFRICQGTLEKPTFTIFSDGVDGWYRVGYEGQKGFGYAPGSMDHAFVGSSYGLMNIYNPKIGKWMRAWADQNNHRINHPKSGSMLDYLTGFQIDIRKPLKGVKP